MRGLVVAAGGAAIVVAGMTGCSSEKKTETNATGTESSVEVTSGSMTASAGAGTATVSIDGNAQDVQGQVACSSSAGTMNIAVGDSAGGTGIAVILAEDASKVTSVSLGNVNGVALGFQEGAPGGNATATKTDKTYKVSGTATGMDMANPMQPTTKPFEIEVTCP